LSQGVAGGEAQALELTFTSWATTSGSGDISEMKKRLQRATPWSAG
jgi:hypothetical protein